MLRSADADRLMHVVFWASGLVLVGTQAWLAVRQWHRARAGGRGVEVAWAVVPALFLIGLGYFGSTR